LDLRRLRRAGSVGAMESKEAGSVAIPRGGAAAEARGGAAMEELKIILLGDSAVGKSKLLERYLMDDYSPQQDSTYALTLFRQTATVQDRRSGLPKQVQITYWDTAGQERFQKMHPSYYFRAHGCVLAFDVTRKATYQHLQQWLDELREYAESIPVLCVANKIDVDIKVTSKAFAFPQKHNLPFRFCSAADGTNVVDVFQTAIQMAYDYKTGGKQDFLSEVMDVLDHGAA
jgi:Rab-like protein 2